MYLQRRGIAAAASVAVKEVLHSAHSADATGGAVELLLGGVILEKAAFQACVGAKLNPAPDAVPAHRLLNITESADHLPDSRPVKLMPLA